MLQKIGTKLRIDRGNSGKVNFTFLKDDGTAYDLSIFTVRFVVKETLTATKTLISKTYTGLTGNELLVELTAEDTENLAAGNFYYGIQFEQSETSSVDTIIQDRFEILATVFNGLSQITPASVTITLQPFSYAASETAAGVAKIATTAEVTAGTDDAKIVTPKKLEEKIDSLNLNATNEILADIDDIQTALNTKIALVKVDEVTAYADISAYTPAESEVVYNTTDNKIYTYTITDGVGAWSAGVEASELTLYLDKSKNLLGYFSGSAFSYLSADYTKMSNLPTINGVTLTGNKTTDELGISGGAATTVDSALSDSSENAVQNKVIKAAIDEKADSASLATVATSGNYNDLSNTPTIPAAVTVDSALSSSSENPVQNKIINTALSGKLAYYYFDDIVYYTDISTYTPTTDLTVYNRYNNKFYIYTLSTTSWDSGTDPIDNVLYISKDHQCILIYDDTEDTPTCVQAGVTIEDFDEIVTYTDISNTWTPSEAVKVYNTADHHIWKFKDSVWQDQGNARQDVLYVNWANMLFYVYDEDGGNMDKIERVIDTALSATSENPVQNKVIKAALDLKASSSALATVATSGSYEDLSNKPTIPSISNKISYMYFDDIVMYDSISTYTPSTNITVYNKTNNRFYTYSGSAWGDAIEPVDGVLYISKDHQCLLIRDDTNDTPTCVQCGVTIEDFDDIVTYADITTWTPTEKVKVYNTSDHHIWKYENNTWQDQYLARMDVFYINWSTMTLYVYDSDEATMYKLAKDIDSALSSTSTNPVENQAIYSALSAKQDTLTAGTNIAITNNIISANSSGIAASILFENYSNTNTYNYKDLISYSNKLYYCNQTEGITTAEDWNSTHWTEFILEDKLFTSDNISNTYSNTNTYKYKSLVLYNNKLYYCNQIKGITTAEEWDSTHWTNINLTDALLPFIKTSTWSDSGAWGGVPVWNGTHWVLSSDDRGVNKKFNIYLGSESDIRDSNVVTLAVGGTTQKTNASQIALFGSCENSANACISIGRGATVRNAYAIALGYYTHVAGNYSVGIGTAYTSGYHSISIDAGYASLTEAPSSFNTQANRINISGEHGTFITTSHAPGQNRTTQGTNPTNIGVLDIMNGTNAVKDKLLVCRSNNTTNTNGVTTITGSEVFSILKNGALQSGYTADTSSTAISLAAVAGQTYRYSGAVTSLTLSTFDGATTLATSNGVNPTRIIVTAGASMSLVLTALTAAFDYILPSGLTFTSGTITGFTEGNKYLIEIKDNVVKIELLTTYTPA